MGSLSRSSSSSSSPAPRTRVLVVGHGSRSVRPSDVGPPRASRLALVCAITAGSVMLVWIFGLLGFQLGFAPATRVPGLLMEPSGALASGAIMIVTIPHCILDAGLAAPLPLMGILLLLALPAGAIVAARPSTPGGPRLKPAAMTLASTGAALAMVSAIAAIAWTGVADRTSRLASIPEQSHEVEAWFHGVRAAAGFDLAVTCGLILFIILLFRLPVALWMRALGLSVTGFGLAVTMTATCASLGTAAHMGAAHAIVQLNSGEQAMILGHTRQQTAVLVIDWQPPPGGTPAQVAGRVDIRLFGPEAGLSQGMTVRARGSVPWFASGR